MFDYFLVFAIAKFLYYIIDSAINLYYFSCKI